MGFVHHDYRVQPGQRADQGGVVRPVDVERHAGLPLVAGQLHEGGVLLIGLAPVLVLERVVGQDEYGQLVAHRRDVKPPARKPLLLVEHLDPMGEVTVNGDAERVGGIAQLPDGLAQDLLAGHEPDHGPRRHLWKVVVQYLEGVRRDECLPAARGHLDAYLRHVVEVSGIAADLPLTDMEVP